jgi:hypothetical protein
MDFKSRFNGKMAHITKDGAFDTVISTQKAQPIMKMGTIGSDSGGTSSSNNDGPRPSIMS